MGNDSYTDFAPDGAEGGQSSADRLPEQSMELASAGTVAGKSAGFEGCGRHCRRPEARDQEVGIGLDDWVRRREATQGEVSTLIPWAKAAWLPS